LKKTALIALLLCLVPAVAQEKQKKLKPGTYAHFATSMGDFTCELYEKDVPKTVANFIGLAEGTKGWLDPVNRQVVIGKPFYDELLFHRVVKSFMIQSGDPTATGAGGPGYKFDDEILPGLRHDRVGRLSMANAGPNTNGSQFFITLVQVSSLDNLHTVFGQVVEGIDVVKKIGQVPTNPATERPLTDIVLKKITIERVAKEKK
jgi:peptidyl-prolyl cis-trans isomerase A (cyclophilin A)